MAKAVAEGAKIDGVNVRLIDVLEATKKDVLQADSIAMGCPSMGCEELEKEAMEPFVQLLEREDLIDKPVALFGSYGWGNGEWMRDWMNRMLKLGVRLVDEGMAIQETTDIEGLAKCRKLGPKLVPLKCEQIPGSLRCTNTYG